MQAYISFHEQVIISVWRSQIVWINLDLLHKTYAQICKELRKRCVVFPYSLWSCWVNGESGLKESLKYLSSNLNQIYIYFSAICIFPLSGFFFFKLILQMSFFFKFCAILVLQSGEKYPKWAKSPKNLSFEICLRMIWPLQFDVLFYGPGWV